MPLKSKDAMSRRNSRKYSCFFEMKMDSVADVRAIIWTLTTDNDSCFWLKVAPFYPN